jgi:hypothetical protein
MRIDIMASKWEVFFIPLCQHTKPVPKPKLVVIVYVHPSPYCFLINSTINDFIKKRAYLLPCEAPIRARQHLSFLTHDSFIDCREAFPFFDMAELTQSRGMLSHDAQQSVLHAVIECPVLEKIHKQRILT